MNEEDLKHYNVYGEIEADRFILNEMLKMLFLYDGFDYYGEC